eukprot:TRINITY_DN14216_c0_g2_i1.p1 TRINITY_DN14216_c0_g2~~TRINITY_DN14216_c0_g2_i1.p1  ORF type:complete len:119 (-),score=25.36 TRINITY_DN14216_c0_g2_i1:89-445(-)
MKMIFFNKEVKDGLNRNAGYGGNLKGDGMQMGASFCMEAGGSILLDHRQVNFADHVSPEDVLSAFNLDPSLLHTPRGKEVAEGAPEAVASIPDASHPTVHDSSGAETECKKGCCSSCK